MPSKIRLVPTVPTVPTKKKNKRENGAHTQNGVLSLSFVSSARICGNKQDQ